MANARAHAVESALWKRSANLALEYPWIHLNIYSARQRPKKNRLSVKLQPRRGQPARLDHGKLSALHTKNGSRRKNHGKSTTSVLGMDPHARTLRFNTFPWHAPPRGCGGSWRLKYPTAGKGFAAAQHRDLY